MKELLGKFPSGNDILSLSERDKMGIRSTILIEPTALM